MGRKITAGMILHDAKQHPIFVHRYKWAQEQRRKLTRRMCKDGLLVLIEETRDGFRYRAATEQKG